MINTARSLVKGHFNRSDISGPSRIMLPTYIGLCAVLGASYAFTPLQSLLIIPLYQSADQLLPMQVWGALFLSLAVIQAVILVALRNTFALQLCLAITGMAMVAWSLIGLGSFAFGDSSSSAWVWPAFVAQACRASARSLRTGGA